MSGPEELYQVQHQGLSGFQLQVLELHIVQHLVRLHASIVAKAALLLVFLKLVEVVKVAGVVELSCHEVSLGYVEVARRQGLSTMVIHIGSDVRATYLLLHQGYTKAYLYSSALSRYPRVVLPGD